MSNINITMYSKDNCPQCTQAEQYFGMYKAPLTVLKLGVDYTMEELHEKFPGARTFPVFESVVNAEKPARHIKLDDVSAWYQANK